MFESNASILTQEEEEFKNKKDKYQDISGLDKREMFKFLKENGQF